MVDHRLQACVNAAEWIRNLLAYCKEVGASMATAQLAFPSLLQRETDDKLTSTYDHEALVLKEINTRLCCRGVAGYVMICG